MKNARGRKQKGDRRERGVVDFWKGRGYLAERVPLSGAAGGSYVGDVRLHLLGIEAPPVVGEVKARAGGEGFATISRWLGNMDVLVLHADRSERLYVVPERTIAAWFPAIPHPGDEMARAGPESAAQSP